jgi:pantothenate kinase
MSKHKILASTFNLILIHCDKTLNKMKSATICLSIIGAVAAFVPASITVCVVDCISKKIEHK